MSIFGLQSVLAIFELKIDDLVSVLLTFFKETIHFQDIVARFAIDLRELHQIESIFVLPIKEPEEGSSHEID